MKQNTAIATVLADAFATVFAGGKMRIYSGAQPASANDAASGTLLCEIDLPNPCFSGAAAGVASKTGVWSGLGLANAAAGWARILNAALTQSHDISVGEVGTEAIIDDENITIGGVVVVSLYDYEVPLA